MQNPSDYSQLEWLRLGSSAEWHVADLIEILEAILAVPELQCFEVELSTEAVLAKARLLRSAVLDELSPPRESL